MLYKYLLTIVFIFNIATVALAEAGIDTTQQNNIMQTKANIPSNTIQQIIEKDTLPKDIILVLDNSGSMRKNDPKYLMKNVIKKFIDDVDESSRIALTIFDQNIQKILPFTHISAQSKQSFLDSLSQLDYKGSLTNSPAAIENAIYDMKNNAREEALKIIIFLTDGIIDTGDPQRDIEKRKWLQEHLANDAADSSIKIFSIAFSEDADFELIQSLAQKTGGEYYRVLTANNLENAFKRMHAEIHKPRPLKVAEPKIIETIKIIEKIIEKPAPVISPAPTPSQRTTYLPEQNLLIVILGVLLLIAIVMSVMIWRKSQHKGTEKTTYPEAYLYYNQDMQVEKCVLDTKAVMLGRIGSEDTDDLKYLVIPESTIGRHHAVIEYKDFGYWIIDQASINGTFVNDEKILTEKKLQHNDIIRLHNTELMFMMPEMEDAGMTVVSKDSGIPQNTPQASMTGNEPTLMTGHEVTLMPKHDLSKKSDS